jgi:hypothetical protein
MVPERCSDVGHERIPGGPFTRSPLDDITLGVFAAAALALGMPYAFVIASGLPRRVWRARDSRGAPGTPDATRTMPRA